MLISLSSTRSTAPWREDGDGERGAGDWLGCRCALAGRSFGCGDPVVPLWTLLLLLLLSVEDDGERACSALLDSSIAERIARRSLRGPMLLRKVSLWA